MERDPLNQELDELRKEVEWYRTVMAENGYGGPAGDAVNPLREMLQDAKRWWHVQSNPYRAIDALLAGVDVNVPSNWSREADDAIDASMKKWGGLDGHR